MDIQYEKIKQEKGPNFGIRDKEFLGHSFSPFADSQLNTSKEEENKQVIQKVPPLNLKEHLKTLTSQNELLTSDIEQNINESKRTFQNKCNIFFY